MAGLPERLLWLLPHNGHTMGVELAAWVIPMLQAAGVTVEVAAVLPAPPGWEPVDRVAGLDLPPPLVSGGIWRGLAATGAVRRLLGDFPAVLVDQDLQGELRVAMAAGGLRRRPALFLLARYPLTEYLAAQGEHRVGRRRRYLEAYYPLFDRVLALSSKVREDLIADFRVPKQRVVRLRPPVPMDRLAASEPAVPWPWPNAEGEAVPVVASWGEWDEVRGGAVLVEAARRLAAGGQALRLLFLGGGPAWERLAAATRQAGLEAAFVPWPDHIGPWLARAQVYVSPAYFDGLGLDVLAAMAVGTPVVATNAPTAAVELLARGTAGRLVSIGEPGALAEALSAWLADSRLRQGYAVGGRQRARSFAAARVEPEWLAALAGD